MEVTKNEIKKVSIKNDRCIVSFNETAGAELNVVSKECGAVIHKDLVQAMNRLKVHLVVLTEQTEVSIITHASIDDFDLTLLDKYVITGYTIGGTDENEGVTIVGQKLLKSGKVLNLVVPFTKYEDEYDFSSELGQDVANCTYEVKEYLFNDKFGIKQAELEFDKQDVNLKDAAEGSMTITMSSRKSKNKKEDKLPKDALELSSDYSQKEPEEVEEFVEFERPDRW